MLDCSERRIIQLDKSNLLLKCIDPFSQVASRGYVYIHSLRGTWVDELLTDTMAVCIFHSTCTITLPSRIYNHKSMELLRSDTFCSFLCWRSLQSPFHNKMLWWGNKRPHWRKSRPWRIRYASKGQGKVQTDVGLFLNKTSLILKVLKSYSGNIFIYFHVSPMFFFFFFF